MYVIKMHSSPPKRWHSGLTDKTKIVATISLGLNMRVVVKMKGFDRLKLKFDSLQSACCKLFHQLNNCLNILEQIYNSFLMKPLLEERVSFSRSCTTITYLSADLRFISCCFPRLVLETLPRFRNNRGSYYRSAGPIFGRAISVTRVCEFYCLYVCSTWPSCLRTLTYTKQAARRKLYKVVHIHIRSVSDKACISCLFLVR